MAKGLPYLETHLEVIHAVIIKEYNKKLDEDVEYPCCRCEHLFIRTNVSAFEFSTDKYNSSV